MSEYTREEVLEMVKAGKSLMGADLREINLSGDYLTGAELTGANLVEASLIGADLIGANLSGAKLRGTDLSEANLNRTNLSGAKLRGADLSWADLREANLSKASLYRVDLKGADLQMAVLKNADLSSADLEGATLNNADISGANIYRIKTPGWKIEGIKCTHIYCYNPFTNKKDKERNKKESRRELSEGEFEAVYKSMPTIELWFRDKFSFTDELRLMDIQYRLQKEVPDTHISLKKKEWVGKDMVITLTVREEDKVKEAAEAVDRLYGDKGLESEFVRRMEDALNKKLFQFIPGIGKALAGDSDSESGEKIGSSVVVNNNFTVILQSGEGHTFVSNTDVNKSAIGPGASVNIIKNYEDNRTKVDELLKELRAGLAQDHKGLVDQFTEALKTKDEGKVRSTWDKIRNGIGTTTNLVSIAGGVAQLLSLYFSR